MSTKNFKGIFTALLTPFDSNNRINEKELERLVKYNVGKGVTGFYVCGSTAEAFLLSADDRKQIMEIVKRTAPDSTLIAHIGSLNEFDAAELGKYANELSYDMVSSVAPFYYKFNFEEIKNYYFRLADASGLPMLVYHFPAHSGVNMGVNEMKSFLLDEKFVGIKYTSNDFYTLERCKAEFPDKIVYNGYDEMFMAGISMGADGGVGSTYNFMAEKFVKIYNLFRENKVREAQEIQKEVNRIISILKKIGVMKAEKEILNQLGFDFGICRRPFGLIAYEEQKLIEKEIIPYLQNV